MSATAAPFAPPWCPNPACAFHTGSTTCWRWVRAGFFRRDAAPHRIQRFQCRHCRRHFSTQTFRGDYWLKLPRLLLPVVNPVWVQYASHKIGRLLVPWALVGWFVSSAVLLFSGWFYGAAFVAQALFYGLAAYGGWTEYRERRAEDFAHTLGEVVR